MARVFVIVGWVVLAEVVRVYGRTAAIELQEEGVTATEVVPRPGGCGNLMFTTSRRVCGSVLVLTVTGEVDLATVEQFNHRVHEELAIGKFSRLVIDVSRLDFCGAAGLAVLSRARETARRRREAPLRVVTGHGPVARLLQLCEVPGLLAAEEHSLDAACHSAGVA